MVYCFPTRIKEVIFMRCGCPECGAFMIHSERDNACVCPQCLYRCYACQGTGTAWSREAVRALKGQAAGEEKPDTADYFPQKPSEKAGWGKD